MENTPITIKFYRERDMPYGCFSNFSPHGFTLDQRHYRTVEHYFQARKFTDDGVIENICQAKSPREAKDAGNDREHPIRADWNDVKDDIMFEGVLAKFQAHDDIREILLDTGNATIVEDAASDYYWGAGADGTSLNKLGEALMKVRSVLSVAADV